MQHVNHNGPFHVLLRANRVVMLAVLWAALAACIAGSLAFDVADWLNAWRGASFGTLTSAALFRSDPGRTPVPGSEANS